MHLRNLEAEVKSLRLERVVAQPPTLNLADAWAGTWSENTTYPRGACTTWDGSMWLAMKSTNRRPGIEDSGWKLIVKRGRDAKGAR